MTAQQIAEHLGALAVGNPDQPLTSAAVLEEAEPDQLAFVAQRKSFAAGQVSRAGCLLVPPDYPPTPQTLIRVPQPRGAFAAALRLLYPKPRPQPGIHPTAVIASSARVHPEASIGPYVTVGDQTTIGAGTSVGAYCAIAEQVKIGHSCKIYPQVTIYAGTEIGDRAVLHSGAILGADGFGFVLAEDAYAKFPQVGRVVLGDDVEVGANTCVDRAALGVTVIGDGTKLDNLVHVGHNCRIGRHVVVAAQTGFSGGVVVEDYAVIGGQVGIGDKARIESRAVLGSGCGVLTSKIVRGGQVVWGTPARPLREYLEQLAHVARLPETVKALRAEISALRQMILKQEKREQC